MHQQMQTPGSRVTTYRTAPSTSVPDAIPGQSRMIAGRATALGLPLLLAFLVTCSVMYAGVPALRHDWRIPVGTGETLPWLETFWSGWTLDGIGEARPYPTFYIVGFLLYPLAFFGASAATAAMLFSGIALAAWSAAECARRARASLWCVAAAAIFAALNPWVYAKEVSGHVLMILAYGLIFAFYALSLQPRPQRSAIVLLAALLIVQIEFFVLAFLPAVAWAIRRKEDRVILAMLFAASPIAFGIALHYGQIAATPFNMTWQNGQSIAPYDAALLLGYSPGYAIGFEPFRVALGLFIIAAVAGIPAASASLRGRVTTIGGIGALLLMTGSRGPFAALYRFGVEHASELGVLRELYDLGAILAIAYVALAVQSFAKRGIAAILLTIAAATLAYPWVATPPASFAVPARELDREPPATSAQSRVAYFPAFQPFSVTEADGSVRGSGVDPDAYARVGRALPLNTFYPSFPLDAAFGRATFAGDERELAELGASALVARPYLHSNFSALRYTWIETEPLRARLPRTHALDAWPILAIIPPPREASIANDPGGDAVFAGDVHARSILPFEPTRATLDPQAAWVDARLAFAAQPDWASALGGVVTQSPQPLPLPRSGATMRLLALARGTLYDDAGRIIVRNDASLHWRPLAAQVTSVHCRGTCLVAAQGTVEAALPEQGPLTPGKPIAFAQPLPWLLLATLPAGPSGALRYTERYDFGWLAMSDGSILDHFRLASALNGWRFPAAPHDRPLLLVETGSALQFIFEIIAASALIVLAFKPTLARESRAG